MKVNSKIRVAIDIRDLQIAATGTRVFLENLLIEFQKNEDTFEFFYLKPSSAAYIGNNKLLKLVEQVSYFYWKQIQLPIKAYKLKSDIVFCSDFMVPYFKLGYKTIPVFHDAFFWEYPTHYNKYWLFLFSRISLAAAKRSFVIATPTHYTQKQIGTYTDIKENKIQVIGEGFKPVSEVTVEDSIIKDKPFVLHVGTFEKRKNITTLIKAFKILVDKGSADLNLVLVGKASNKPALNDIDNIKGLISKMGLANRVILTGYLSDAQVAYLYKKASLYVFASFNEGFGLPVLEAFYYKVPLIVADNSCLTEVAREGAIKFNPFDEQDLATKMDLLLTNPLVKDELVQKGLERLQYFSWEKTANILLSNFKLAAKSYTATNL